MDRKEWITPVDPIVAKVKRQCHNYMNRKLVSGVKSFCHNTVMPSSTPPPPSHPCRFVDPTTALGTSKALLSKVARRFGRQRGHRLPRPARTTTAPHRMCALQVSISSGAAAQICIAEQYQQLRDNTLHSSIQGPAVMVHTIVWPILSTGILL